MITRLSKGDPILILILAILSLVKFANLSAIPPFGDESLYMWLADQFRNNPSLYLDSIIFGVFPITIWLLALVHTTFGNFINLLILDRSLMAFADILTGFFVFLIGKKIFNKSYGFTASIIYLALPLTFFHGRVVMLESLTNLFSTIAIYIFVKAFADKLFFKSLNWAWVSSIAFFMLLSFFTKPLAIISFIPIAISPVLLLNQIKKLSKKEIRNFLINYVLIFIILGLGLILLYLPISNQFSSRYISENKNFLSLLKQLKTDLWKTFFWTKIYITVPIMIVSAMSIALGLLNKSVKILWLSLWLGLSLALEGIFSANFYPRHLYPLSVIIALLAPYLFFKLEGLSKRRFKILSSTLLFLTLIPSLLFIKMLVTAPDKYSIAPEDRQQFYEDWTSGLGYKEMADKLNTLSNMEETIVFTENDPQLFWTIPHIYSSGQTIFYPSQNLTQGKFLDKQLLETYQSKEIYILLNRNPDPPTDWPLTLIYKTPKGPNRSINLYKITKSF